MKLRLKEMENYYYKCTATLPAESEHTKPDLKLQEQSEWHVYDVCHY